MPVTGVAAAGVDPAAALVDALNAATAATTAATTALTASTASALQKSSNLSDVASVSASRTSLGLGSAAQLASTAVAQVANNLSDLASAATARANLGVSPSTRLVSAGTGLTGGGDLSADRTFAVDFAASGVSSSTKATRADDSRLSDTRTPSASSVTTSTLASGLVIDGGSP